MNNPRLDPEVLILHAALQLPSEQRAAYLDEACAGNALLRQLVEDLILANTEAGAFLDTPAYGVQQALEAEALISQGEAVQLPLGPSEKPGDWIGRYKLLQQIGEGGCGVVYMAEQEEPVRRMVALKVIKLGMDTKSFVARFEAERQALARMDHPNIAKVLDAGATETGRPYFVMELVRGLKITDYCDANNLTTSARLGLFVQVCQAIQHAHQKGIIHRDIKPSNILVTTNEGAPVCKVIDFGIAKATEGRLTNKTLFTAFEQFLGTPAYMSPEQADLGARDIDTRSDIYSLGVLLYELLTGQTPFDTKMLLQAGLDEIRRTIREKEPARPSTCLSTMLGADLTVIAKRRRLEPPKLIHLLRGDLDWIVMKSLEKDRARRYETANGLSADVQRHLKNEPVAAGPPSNFYKFQKLIRRNKLVFAAAALMAMVLLAATGISVWQAALARQRLVEAEAISQFLTEVFQSPDPSRDARTMTVAEALGAAVKKLETDLASQPARRVRLQATLARTYYKLDLDREAIPLQEKVRDYCLANSGPEHPDTLQAIQALATSYYEVGRQPEALKLREQVLALRRKVSGAEDPATLAAMGNLAVSYDEANRREDALKLREQLLPIYLKMSGPTNPATLNAMQQLAISYAEAGRKEEALKLREEVVVRRREVLGAKHPDTLWAMHNLAISYENAGRREEALKLREEVLALRRKVLGPEASNTIWSMHTLATSYDEAGRHTEALKLREEVLALRRKIAPEHPATMAAMQYLAISYEEAGRLEEALKLREQALALDRKVYGAQNPETLDAMPELANLYGSVGRDREAISLLEEDCKFNPKDMYPQLTLATWQAWFGLDADYEATRRRIVQQAEGTDQAAEADRAAEAACLRPSADATMLAKALNLARRGVELGKSNSYLPYFRVGLGLAEYRNAQYTNAERNFTVAEETLVEAPESLGIARLFHAMSLFRLDKPEEARRLFSQAEAQMPSLPHDERKPHSEGRRIDPNLLAWWLAYKEAKTLIAPPK